MKRIVRLTESDLVRLVKRVIKEDELSQSTDGKDCVQQIRKLYISNGFIADSPYGDNDSHTTSLTYQKKIPNVTYGKNWWDSVNPASVDIELTDYHTGSDFAISIIAKSHESRDNKIKNLDPKVKNLLKNTKYKDEIVDKKDSMVVVKRDLNCETVKTELINTIKPLLQSLSRLGYKRI